MEKNKLENLSNSNLADEYKKTFSQEFIPIYNELGEVVNRDPNSIKPINNRRYVIDRSKKRVL